MSLSFRFLAQRLSRKASRRKPHPQRRVPRLRLELLEDRTLPDVTLVNCGVGPGVHLLGQQLAAPADELTYQFEVLHGDSIDVSLTYASPEDPFSFQVTTQPLGGTPLGTETSTPTGQKIALLDLTPGTYYAHVSGRTAAFGFSIDPGPASSTRVLYVNDANPTNDVYTTALGDDANNGLTPDAPKATLQNILATYDLGPNDLVVVDTGTYGGTVVVTTEDEGTTFAGSPAGSAFDYTGTRWELVDADLNLIYGLRFTGAGGTGLYIHAGVSSPSVQNIIRNNLFDGPSTAIFLGTGDSDLLVNNTIQGSGSYGIRLEGGTNQILRNNTIQGQTYGIATSSSSGLNIDHNTLTGNGTGLYAYATSLTVTGNTIATNILNGFGLSLNYGSATISGNDIGSCYIGLDSNYTTALVFGNVVHDSGTGLRGTGLFGGSDWSTGQPNDIFGNQTGIAAYDGVTVRFNYVHHNAIGIVSGSHNNIHHNLIYRNTGQGLLVNNRNDVAFLNNTVFTPSGDAVRVLNSSQNISLSNNILWTDSGYDLFVSTDSQQGFASDYNNLFTANPGPGKLVWWQKDFQDLFDWQVEADFDSHSIGYTVPTPALDNPQFANLAGDNYRLTDEVSTSIDAGNPLSLFDNEPDPNGNRIDLGAFGNTARAARSRSTYVAVTYPNYYLDWGVDQAKAIQWRTFGTATDDRIRIDLYEVGVGWLGRIADVPAADGAHGWSPQASGLTGSMNRRFFLRLTLTDAAGTTVKGQSDSREAFSVPPAGTDYYVNDQVTANDYFTTVVGNNRHTGKTPDDPKANLLPLLRSYDLEPLDVVHIDTGNYIHVRNVLISGNPALGDDEGVVITGPVDPGTGQPIPGKVARIDRANTNAGSTNIELNDGDYVVLQALTLTGAQMGLWVHNASTYFTGKNLTVSNNAGDGIRIESDATGTVVDRLSSFDNAGSGIVIQAPIAALRDSQAYDNNGDGIYLSNCGAARFERNEVYGNTNGMVVSNWTGTAIIGNPDLSQLAGNLIHHNRQTGIRASGNVLVAGNAVWQCQLGIEVSGGTTAQSNIVFLNNTGIRSWWNGLVSGNTVYANSEIGIQAYQDSRVSGNTVYSNSVGIQADPYWSNYVQVSNNLVYDNSNQGIIVNRGSGVRLVNNTVFQAGSGGIRIQSGSANTSLRNNILWVQAGYDLNVAADSQVGFNSDFNVFYATDTGQVAYWQGIARPSFAAWQNAAFTDANSAFQNPLFVDPDGADNLLGYTGGDDHGRDDDFHEQSQYSTFAGGSLSPILDPGTGLPVERSGSWTPPDYFPSQSPVIDRGDPSSYFGNEPAANGGYVNIGAYGNTAQASRSAPEYIMVTRPDGGEIWPQGQTFPIRWRGCSTSENALALDGVNDFVAVADSPSLRPASLTVEGWFNFASLSNYPHLIQKAFGSYYQESFALYHDDTRLNGGIKDSSFLSADWVPTLNRWYHLAYTFDDATKHQALYIGGTLVAEGTLPGGATLAYDSHTLLLGAGYQNGEVSNFLSGQMDEIRIWNVARTQAELLAGMNQVLTGTETGLAGYWRLDEGTGITSADLSGQGNTATLGNGVAANMPTWIPSRAPVARVDIDLLDALGNPILPISTGTANDGEFFWTIPTTGLTPGSYQVRVTRTDRPDLTDTSNFLFTVHEPIHEYFVNDDSTSGDYYCTAVGSDANDGLSAATPMASIRAVLEAYDLGPGDVIKVDVGTYLLSVNIVITDNDSGVLIQGYRDATDPNRRSLIDRGNTSSGSYVMEFAGADGVTVSDLAFTGGQYGLFAGDGVDSDDITFSHCDVYANSSDNLWWGSSNNDRLILSGNTFRDAGDNGARLFGGGHQVSGNTFRNNSQWGLLVSASVAPVTVEDNVFVANYYGISASGGGDSQVVIRNNQVHDQRSTGINASGNVLVTGNAIWQCYLGVELFNGVTVQGNEVFLNQTGLRAYWGGVLMSGNRVYANSGIGIQAYQDSRVFGNTVYSNSVGIQADPYWSNFVQVSNNLVYGNSNQGIIVNAGNGVRLVNNTVYQPVGDAVKVQGYSANTFLRNNLLWIEAGYDINVADDSHAGFSSNYNLLYHGSDSRALTGYWNGDCPDLTSWRSSTGQDDHSVADPPNLVDINGADNVLGYTTDGSGYNGGRDDNFYPAGGSPLIDRADVWAAPVADIYGHLRHDDPGIDPNLGSADYAETVLASSFFSPTGTAQNWRSDNTYWSLDLPFAFPFYDQAYTTVYVSSEGFLQLGTADQAWDPANSSNSLLARRRIAPLWDDLSTWGTGDDIYVDISIGGQVTIRWDATNQADGSDVNFAVVLFADGTIRFDYGSGNTDLTPTAGLSYGNGVNGLLASTNGAVNLTNVNSREFNLIPGVSFVDIGAIEFLGSSDDTTPPTLTATSPDGIHLAGNFPDNVHDLTLNFSERLNPIDAGAPGNYELRAAGLDDTFDTADDFIYTLNPIYGEETSYVQVAIQGVTGRLPLGRYRLTVYGSATTALHDLSGLVLDGDLDGVPGGNYVRIFTVIPAPLAEAGGPYAIVEGQALDLDGSGSSGPVAPIVAWHWDLDGDGDYADAEGVLATVDWDTLKTFGLNDGPGSYTIGLRVTDANGFVDTDTATVSIANQAPTLTLSGDTAVAEGSVFVLTFNPVSDPGADTVSVYGINWGDGRSDSFTAAEIAGMGNRASHIYADGPNDLTITVDLTDEDGTYPHVASKAIHVNNVAPNLTVTSNTTIHQYELLSLADIGTFTDPGFDSSFLGTQETFHYSIDWGDGTTADTGTATIDVHGSPGVFTRGSFDGSHTYDSLGAFTVTVTVTDDDGGTDHHTFSITVTNLYEIYGNDDHNFIAFTAQSDGRFLYTVTRISDGFLLDSGTIQRQGIVTVHAGEGTDGLGIQGTDNADTFSLSNHQVLSNTVSIIGDQVEDWIIEGLGGNDTFIVQAGTSFEVIVDGGIGANTLDYSSWATAVRIDLSRGSATGTLRISAFQNVLSGSGDDTLVSGSGNETLNGGAGNDTYVFNCDDALGTDTITELTDGGSDTLDFSSTTLAGITVSLASDAAQTVAAGRLTLTLSAGNVFENATGGALGDTITGNSLDDLLTGGGGNDILDGGDGNDNLQGGDGNDSLQGGGGDDSLTGGLGNDIYLFNCDNALGTDTLTELVGGGTDTLDFSPTATVGLTVNLASTAAQTVAAGRLVLTLSAGDVIENATGGALADTFTGNSLNNLLTGGAGNDTYLFNCDNGLGSDTITELAGGGSDALDFSSTTTVGLTLNLASTAAQTVASPRLTLTLSAGNAIENLTGGALADNLTGNTLVNSLIGGDGNDTLNGGDANDSVYGGAGDDNLYGGAGDDLLYGGDGNDAMDAGSGNDTLHGDAGNDTLYGGAGTDTLNGGDGEDALYGLADNDALRGGAGNDTYYFDADTAIGADILTEAVGAGSDRLDFTQTGSFGITLNLASTGAQVIAGGNLTLTLSANNVVENVNGTSLADTITGNDLDNVLAGFGGNNTLSGGSGHDTLSAGSGNDSLTGGAGNDVLSGGSGDDYFDAGSGTDTVNGEAGNDTLYGASGDDSLNGGDGNDALYGQAGNDALAGGAGNDTSYFDADTPLGADTIIEAAGGGTDVVDFVQTTTVAITVDLSSTANQTVVAGNLTLTLLAGDVLENIKGGSLDDTLTGNSLANNLNGGSGNDTLRGWGGNDTLVGSAGNDTLSGDDGDDYFDAGTGNDTLSGGAGNDTLYGGAGNDSLNGGAGDDALYGQADNDTLAGGAGNDTYWFPADTALGSDTLTELVGEGTDLLNFSQTLTVAINLNLSSTAPQVVAGANLSLTLTNGEVLENVTGGAQADTLTGNGLVNVINGVDANDTLRGGGGADSLIGGAGNDTLYGDDGDDYLTGGSGDDTMSGGAGNDTLDAGSGNDALSGEGGADTLYGGDGNDTLSGGDGNDKLTGGAGNDAQDGGAGNDTYYSDADTLQGVDTITEAVGGGTDLLDFAQTTTVGITLNLSSTAAQIVKSTNLTLTLSAGDVIENVNGGNMADMVTGNVLDNTLMGQDGNDTLNGLGGNDTLSGGPGDDTLDGGAGNDSIDAGSGNDLITGGAGNDTLNGSSGNDIFVFDTDSALGSDTVDDASGKDWLDFSKTEFQVITLNLTTTTAQVVNGNLTLAVIHVENVVGGSLGDTITGNSDQNILVGGAGDDTLDGGTDRDLIFGGSGADILRGGNYDDVLAGGLITPYFNESTLVLNRAALDSIMAEWASANPYATRVNNLQVGGGLNGTNVLNNTTVFDDAGAIDQLFGQGMTDWFLVSVGDTTDAGAGEIATIIP